MEAPSPHKQLRLFHLLIIAGLGGIALMIFLLRTTQFQSLNRETTQTIPVVSSEKEISFAAAGDYGTTQNAKDVFKTISNLSVDFALGLGDLSYGEVNEREWCKIVTDSLGTTFPFQLVAGNHDVIEDKDKSQGDIQSFASCLPNRMSNMVGIYAQNYYFDQETLARIILISPDISVKGREYSFEKDSEDYMWLSDTIDDARSKNIRWIIVGMHKNCITIGEKTCEIGTDLIDLLATKSVDLVLQGHEHGYSRTKQLTINEACPALLPDSFKTSCVHEGDAMRYKKGEGSIIAIPGTGGAKLRDIDLGRPEGPYFAYYSGSNIDPAYGVTLVTISEGRLQGAFARTDGTKTDTFEIIASD